jgi:hypothetical protein
MAVATDDLIIVADGRGRTAILAGGEPPSL